MYLQLSSLDRYVLHHVAELCTSVTRAYETYQLRRVLLSLSSFQALLAHAYLDQVKDRLYMEPSESRQRRAAQTVLAHALHAVTRALAPLVPHLAEDVHQHTPEPIKLFWAQAQAQAQGHESVFTTGWFLPETGFEGAVAVIYIYMHVKCVY